MTADEIIFETPQIDGLSVTINGVATNNPSNILWDWGDGSSVQQQWFPASHVYAQAGTYTITATANYGGYSLDETYSVSTSTSTTITISESYITTSTSTSTSTSSDMIMQFVYWYPPSEMTQSTISAIGTNGYYGFIAVNLDLGVIATLFGIPIVYMPNAQNTGQIFLTPEAYTTWYINNIETLAGNTTLTWLETTLESPVNGYSNYEEANKAYIEQLGYYWKPYTSGYATTYNVADSALDPVKLYGLSSSELYMLIAPAGSTSTTTLNQGALQTEMWQNTQAVQNQTQGTSSLAQIVSSTISNLNQGNSSSTTTTTSTTTSTTNTTPPSNPPSIFSNIDFDIALGIIGVLAVVGAILLLS